MKKNLKIIFFGTPEFAAIVLEKMIAANYIPSAIVCNPDEPVGRKKILTPPPVKLWIMEHKTCDITIMQPEKIDKDFTFWVSSLKPELAIVAAYGKMLPKDVLDIPTRGFINLHGSLLPAYRGASPIQCAILNGEKETGVTIMKIDEEMDHGPTLANSKLQIANGDTYETLSKKLAELGAELLIKTIPDYISGKIKPVEQEHSKATYTKITKKGDGKVNWSKSAPEIERMTRAFYLWPGAYANIKNQILKIIEVNVSENGDSHQIGEVFLTPEDQLAVRCGKGILIIKKLQLEGGKVLTAKEFLNGHKDFIGSILQ